MFAGNIFSGTADGKVIRIKADLTTEAVVSLGSPNCGKIKTPCNTLLKVFMTLHYPWYKCQKTARFCAKTLHNQLFSRKTENPQCNILGYINHLLEQSFSVSLQPMRLPVVAPLDFALALMASCTSLMHIKEYSKSIYQQVKLLKLYTRP